MDRLVDAKAEDSADLRLAELFRVAFPLTLDPFRKRRVLVRLQRHASRRRARLWSKPVLIASLLLSGGTAAALGQRYVSSRSVPVDLAGAPGASASQASLRPRLAPLGAPERGVAPPPVLEQSEPPVSVQAVSKGGTRSPSSSTEEAERVVEAIQALRTERDPARAQVLLNDYLKQHPNGQLSGEALALSIEAASERHDPRASDYARRYLAAHPKGKYRSLAQRALAARP